MLFNSYVFMFAFLPAVWLLYAAALGVSWRLASPVLAAASLFFYGWWDIRFLPLLILSILFNFVVGRRIASATAGRREGAARAWTAFGVAANLAALGFFKYADFLVENVAAVAGAEPALIGVLLPIGISFFTFQQIAYLADVRAGRSERYRLTDYAVFVSFFPQLIAGPIVHHREMMPQFSGRRRIAAEDVALGLTVFIAGLFKKVVIADHVAAYASPVFAAADAGGDVSMAEAWGGALAYTCQLYFDFSGYSDMAIGLGRMFGIKLPLNFNSPYQATSIIDFWRRWHMTLSRFLRDYLYIPLGGNRLGAPRRYANLLTTMLLGGLWHGAGWGFVIWGGLHGLYICVNHVIRAAAARSGAVAALARARWLGWAVTFAAVVFAWVFFRATTLHGALEIAGAMLGADGITVPAAWARPLAALGAWPERLGVAFAGDAAIALKSWALEGAPMIAVALAIALLAPNTNRVFLARDGAYHGLVPARPPALVWRPSPVHAVAASALFVVAALYASSISEFLYFQF